MVIKILIILFIIIGIILIPTLAYNVFGYGVIGIFDQWLHGLLIVLVQLVILSGFIVVSLYLWEFIIKK